MAGELRVVGLAEVAETLGVSKRTASRYAARAEFPRPAVVLAMGPIWLLEDVEAWASTNPIALGRPPLRTRRTQASEERGADNR